MKKITIIYLALILALPVLLQAQYTGGIGRGDASIESLNNVLTNTGIINNTIPVTYSLSQNYPNPINPTTNVKFSISNVQFVTLKVFDMLGKEIAILVNEKLDAGEHNIKWNASEYPSGVYSYQLTAGNFRETKRMILIK